MSKKAKKNLLISSVTLVIILSLSLSLSLSLLIMKIHFLPAQTNEEENTLLSPRIISTNTTEEISKRNEWQREFIVEKEIEYFDSETREMVRETIQSKIVEVGSGINYLDGDEWKPSNPHFVQTPNGFELVESCYKVKFGHRLTDVMTYESNGVSIPMQISSIIISDGINQRTLTPNVNVIGTIDQNNASILHFINGFNNIDVTYRADKGGFHQDVKIKNLASLQFDGINERNAKVYVYTKIDDTAFSLNRLAIKKGEEAIDTTSPLFSSTAPSKSEQLIITKTSDTKEIPLFGFDQSAIFDSEGKETASATRQIIKYPNTTGIYLVEAIEINDLEDGSIIDYYGWQGTITEPTVWTADATYTITGDLNLSAELKIEPGTLVKFYGNYSINVNSGGKIIAEGEPWNYIVFTAAYSSSPGSYDEAINISGGSSDSRIRYCKINYATEGIQIQNCTLSTPIRDNIIANCTKGMRFLDGAPNQIINNLIYSCTSIGVEILGLEGTYTLYSNTIDNCGTCIYVGGDPEAEDPTVIIRDTIVTNWTTNGIKVLYNADMDVDYITYFPINNPDNWASGFTPGSEIEGLSSSPYATNSVMGNYYLNSDYLTYYANDGEATANDRGFDNGKYTYILPTLFSTATTIDEDTTWDKCADPEYLATDYVTRGYHHNRVDYLINDVDVSVTDGILTIEPGVVTAVYSSNTTSKRLLITTGSGTSGKINCSGLKANSEIDYPIFTSKKQASMLIETNASSLDYTTGINLSGSESDNVIKFTKFNYLRNGLTIGKDSDYEATDCIFTLCDKGLTTWGYDINTRNHLFYYNNHAVYVNSTSSDKTIEFYNLTCDRQIGTNGNGIYLYAWTGDTIKVYDTLFSNLNYGIKYDTYSGTLTTDYCRYFKTTYNISGSTPIGDNSVDLGDTTNTPYDTTTTAWSDRWFLDQTKTEDDGCVDTGSKHVINVDLQYKTTTFSEGVDFDIGIVDIGYHYPTEVYVQESHFDNDDEPSQTNDIGFNYGEQVENRKISIYNSNGELVYQLEESASATSINMTWDGVGNIGSFDDVTLDTGTYTVIITGGVNDDEYAAFQIYIEQDGDISITRPESNTTINWF